MINFMKNITIMGGFLYVIAFGAGELSLDAKRARRPDARARPPDRFAELKAAIQITHSSREALAWLLAERTNDEKHAS